MRDQIRAMVKLILSLLLLLASSNNFGHSEERIPKIPPDPSTSTMSYGQVTTNLGDPKYNVCLSEPLQRSEHERTCHDGITKVECVYGTCQRSLVDMGGWQGYKFHCQCDIGAQGLFCQYKCCRYCGENGDCHVNHHDTKNTDNVTRSCECKFRYRGEVCELYVPPPTKVVLRTEEDTWYLWVVGVCAGTFILLILGAVGGSYYMWKHRVILIMKIVHYFQSYEDDDEKQWDAFVSYRADETDERFVLQQIYPMLEQEMGFKLCLHFRDFQPGETIANNIINAVEGSRRTILILTPRYVQSEFTRFEYQKAQQEMLKRKHRIIPLMLESISEVSQDLDKNLKGIINAVTYLEWPGVENDKKIDKFWKRLQLSMPKIKDSESERSRSIRGTHSSSVKSDSSDKTRSYFRSASEQSGVSGCSAQTDETFIPTDTSNDDGFSEDIYMEITPTDDIIVDFNDPIYSKIESTCA